MEVNGNRKPVGALLNVFWLERPPLWIWVYLLQ